MVNTFDADEAREQLGIDNMRTTVRGVHPLALALYLVLAATMLCGCATRQQGTGTAIDLNQALQFGLLEKFTETIASTNLANRAGQIIPSGDDPLQTHYKVITTLYGNDLATVKHPERAKDIVSFGLILQATNNDVVIAIRGPDDIWEWLDDFRFPLVDCPFLAEAGKTEAGFTALYQSLRIDVQPASSTVVKALQTFPPALKFQQPIGAVTIIGHSLGGALATLMALDLATNTNFKNPAVYTYASPRTGDSMFARTYNRTVTDTVRIVNRKDFVPTLPPFPFYAHVAGLYEIPFTLNSRPTTLVKPDLGCEHQITTYLHLLSFAAQGVILPITSSRIPSGGDEPDQSLSADQDWQSWIRDRKDVRLRLHPWTTTNLLIARHVCELGQE